MIVPTKTQNRKIVRKSVPRKNPFSELSSKRIPAKSFLIAILVIAVVLLIGFFKNQFVVASVNGEPVTRVQLISELEKRQGKAALDNIISEMLVLQEAKSKKISVSEKEVEDQIKTIEKNLEGQGQKLDTLLTAQNVSRKDLEEQVRLQLMLKKLVGTVEITDKEIADFIEQNKEILPESTDEAQLNNQVKQQLEQQKTGEKIQTLVSELQQKAKIEYLLKL
jgi:hypothetical protein